MTAKRAAPPPADLDSRSRALWTLTRRQLMAQHTWQDSDAGVLERYVRALERARLARAEVAAHGLTALGSQGQLVAHPALRIAREAERDAHLYAQALLLTPEARKRHEVEVKSGKVKFDGLT